ncbi:hypothetical protein CsSME_00026070 [Camellia sinensis var. sinensis]
MSLFFKIPGYNNFTLQNDEMDNMVSLARFFRLQCIDVVIQLQDDQDAENIGSLLCNVQSVTRQMTGKSDESDVHDEPDLLAKFCPYVDKVFFVCYVG